MEDFDKTLRLDPYYAIAYSNRGLIYFVLHQNQRAIEDFDQAIRLDPDMSAAYGGRGVAYYELGQQEKALRDLVKACELGFQPACGMLK